MKKKIWIPVFALFIGFSAWHFLGTSPEEESSPMRSVTMSSQSDPEEQPQKSANQSPISKIMNFVGSLKTQNLDETRVPNSASETVKKEISYLKTVSFSAEERRIANEYFQYLLSSEPTRVLFEKSKKLFGSEEAGLAAARFIVLTSYSNSSTEFQHAFLISLKEMNEDPDAVFQSIEKSTAELRNDPFIYQMTMNMVRRLDLGTEKMTEFFGKEIEYQLSAMKTGKEDGFWIAALGLQLAQQTGLNKSHLGNYLNAGLAKAQGSKKAIEEFASLAEFYLTPN